MPLVYTDGIVFCVSYGAQMALEKQENQIHLSKSSSSCGCSSMPSQQYSTSSEPVAKKSQWVSYYHIPRMDCAAEEQMVRIALAPYADDIQELHLLVLQMKSKTIHLSYSRFCLFARLMKYCAAHICFAYLYQAIGSVLENIYILHS